jgi:hypothetical protein
MLIAHRIIDLLLGRSREKRLDRIKGIPPKYELLLARDIIRAEKFEFVSLPLEPSPTGTGVAVPQITPDEAEAWQQGLLPLPAPCVWYEHTLDGCRTCYLIQEDFTEGEWVYERLDWLYDTDSLMLFGLKIGLDPKQFSPTDFDADTKVHYMGNTAGWQRLSQAGKEAAFGIGDGLFALYLTLMINSRTTEILGQVAPKHLNRSRVKRNHAPLYDHRVVRIVPQRFVTPGEGHGGTHASPRLHWRRSHIRTLQRGTPEERRIPIPRMLVGRADLGEAPMNIVSARG